MNKLNYEILSAIDNIETTVMESEMNVMTSIIDSYDKAVMILEYCNDDVDTSSFDIFQESVIMEADENGEKNKNFINNIIDKIKSAIKKLSSFVKSLYDKIKKIKAMHKDKHKYYYFPLGLFKVYDAISNLASHSGYYPEKITPEIINKLLEYDEDEIKEFKHKAAFSEIHDTGSDIKKLRDAVNTCINAIKHAEEPDDVKNEKHRDELAYLKPINEILEEFDKYFGEFRKKIDMIAEAITKLNDMYDKELYKNGMYGVDLIEVGEEARTKYPEYENLVKCLWELCKRTSTGLALVDNLLIEILNNPPSDDAVKKYLKRETNYIINYS